MEEEILEKKWCIHIMAADEIKDRRKEGGKQSKDEED
jgi:hypothetical protein